MQDDQKPPAEQKPVTSTADPSSSSPKLPDASKKSVPAISSEAVSRTESKISQFFRSFLRWTAIVIIIFGAGMLAEYYLFYVPKSNDFKLAEQELATANAKINELQGEITTLENQVDDLSTFEERNQSLQAGLDMTQLHVHLLEVLIDIRTAQYALVDGDPATATEVLENTTATLTDLQLALEGEQAQITALLSRLELAIGELETNSFAAQSDLEVLAKSLLELEEMLFNEP